MVQDGDFIKITVGWDVPFASAPVLNVWDFECTGFENPTELQIAGPFIAPAFLTRFIDPILPAIASRVGVVSLSMRSYADASEGYDIAGLFGVGLRTGPSLPGFVTFPIQMQRFNYAIRNGRKGIPGCTTEALNLDGSMTDGTRTIFQTAFASWMETFTIEVGENLMTLATRIVRDPAAPNTNPTVYSPVQGYSIPKHFGSQNSRKV